MIEMTRQEKKLYKRAKKSIKKTEMALEKARKLCEKESEAVNKFRECAENRYARCEITNKEKEYIVNDVLAVEETMG